MARAEMIDLFKEQAAKGRHVIISSHILPEVQQLADVVGIVNDGRLIREGSLTAMLAERRQLRQDLVELLAAGASIDSTGGGSGGGTFDTGVAGADGVVATSAGSGVTGRGAGMG